MSMQAVALVRVGLDEVEKAIEGTPVRAKGLDDATLLFTPLSAREDPEEIAVALRQLLGDLLDRHVDPKGILVFPDSVQPKATSYQAVADEVGDLGEWVPVVAAEEAGGLPGGFDPEALLSMLGSDVDTLQAAVMSGDPAALQSAMEAVQRIMADPAKAKMLNDAMAAIGPMLPQGLGDVDMAAAEEMLKGPKKPE